MHAKFERKCVACRQNKQQSEMLRIAKVDGKVKIDSANSMFGRGAYVCKQTECIKLAIKKRLFNRSFKANLNQEFYKELEEYAKNN